MSNHNHSHHEPLQGEVSLNGIFITSILLNLLFVGTETAVGFLENSLSLLSDAGHNLSDVFSLLLVLLSFRLSKIQRNKHFTYGYKKSTILVSLLNAIILLIAVGAIIIESIHKFQSPSEVNGLAVSWTAGVGILVNGATAWMLLKGQKKDINVRGAFLHMAADTLVSVGVLISGVIITYTGFYQLDPIVSLVIAGVILFSTWHLLADSLRLSLDGTPEGIELDAIETILKDHPNVCDIHHVHLWAISTTDNALTAHIVVDNLENMESVKCAIKHRLVQAGICHATLEMETKEAQCHEQDCH